MAKNNPDPLSGAEIWIIATCNTIHFISFMMCNIPSALIYNEWENLMYSVFYVKIMMAALLLCVFVYSTLWPQIFFSIEIININQTKFKSK